MITSTKPDFLEGLRFTYIYVELKSIFSLKYLLSLTLGEIFFHDFESIYECAISREHA